MAMRRRRARIISVTVRVRASNGRQVDVPINLKKYDALFLSEDAVENILVPFYVARRGLAFALQLRAKAEHQLKRTGGVVLLAHELYCDPSLISPPGS
jgi:hypothetical protein